MTISQVLAQAAKLVERDGWCQKVARIRNSQGEIVARCAFGALRDAGYETMRYDPVRFMEDYLRLETGLGPWNDAPGRTGPEVACWLSSASEFAKVLGR